MLLITVKPSAPISGSLLDSNRVDDKRISLPMSDRVAIEGGVGIFRVGTTIRMYHPEIHGILDHHHDAVPRSDDLHRPRQAIFLEQRTWRAGNYTQPGTLLQENS